MGLLNSLGMEIKVTLLGWLLIHSLFIRGDIILLLIVNPFNLHWFGVLLLSLANAILRSYWQSINRFFHVFWVQSKLRNLMRKNAILYLHSNIPGRNLTILLFWFWLMRLVAGHCPFAETLGGNIHIRLVIDDVHLG